MLAKTILLRAPRLNLINLYGAEGELACRQDLDFFGSLFTTARVVNEPPVDGSESCDVLFVYSKLTRQGGMTGCSLSPTDLMQLLEPRIVVFSRDNDQESVLAAALKLQATGVPLVLTIHRRGACFGRFFAELFTHMRRGATMTEAWVRIVPPGDTTNLQLPDTIFINPMAIAFAT